MKKQCYFLLIGLISISFFAKAQQENSKRILINSPIERINEEEFPGAVIFQKGDSEQVYIEHDGAEMWCDLAFFYKEENFVKAYRNVRMKQGDSVSMRSKYIEYNGDTKFAYAAGNVFLKKDTTTVTTDTMYFNRNTQQAYYRTGGVVTSPNSKITSRVGRYYIEDDKISFINQVVVTNPEYTILSEQLDFYSVPEHAYLYGPTTITSKTSKVYCERGFYDTANDYGYFVKNSRIDYDNRQVYGDSLYFDRNKNFASATNNIKVLDTINRSLIKGHYAEVYRAKDSVMITQRAVAITVEDNDSVYVHGDKLLLTGKPENRIIRAYKNVKLYKSNLSGKSDSLHTNQATGLTQMIGKPILWNEQSQITGDSIHLISNTKTEKIDSLKVFDNAFIAQKDSISGYNQIKGQKLFGFFNKKNELERVDIIKNAESIVYLREENGELIGIDKSKSASIEIIFTEQTIDEVYKRKNPGGDIFPESQFLDQSQTFEGFNWRGEERLLSKEDIFKGEAPFVLREIEGIPLPEIDESFFMDNENIEKTNLPETSEIQKKDFKNREEDQPKFIQKATDKDIRKKREDMMSRNSATGLERSKQKSSQLLRPKFKNKKTKGN
ncbi:OstA-like protein [Dokdonia sp. Hel_I_53]|uniref:OstA-like protein n=1 Tax=Dokdonia sp. Hel_I_53 TaxID=1566287 RepID=UPI00119B4C86|nr:OstA-like protein [Dokdonia sp. Hel_I_53]TVZ51746.1 OstA-like protein [Dokdonia sp. Hel_I_53]